jgi:hypothetical protein
MARTRLSVLYREKGVARDLLIPIPADQVITTTLVISSGADKLPTL